MLFPFRPETPMTERLRFLTEVLLNKDGSEQRVSLRAWPRVEYDFSLSLENLDRRRIENLLFANQTGSFELPLWADPQYLDAGAASGATSLALDPSVLPYWFYKDAQDVLVWQDEETYEVAHTSGLLSSSLLLAAPLGRSYPAGTQVLALRPARIAADPKVVRYPINLSMYGLTFMLTDNALTLPASSFTQYAGKYVLDGANAIAGTLSESLTKHLFIVDNQVGPISPVSFWDRNRRISQKTFQTSTREGLWEVRKFLYGVRGQQVSFYLPTFGEDFVPTSNLAAAGVTLNVQNVGYAENVNCRTPRNVVRVATTSGASYTRNIVAASATSDTIEQLTVNAVWGDNVNAEDIARIDFLEKVRLAADDVTFTHTEASGQAQVTFPVKSVIE